MALRSDGWPPIARRPPSLRLRYWIGRSARARDVLSCHLFMLGASYTLREDGHVRVDVLYRRWSRKRRAMVNAGGIVFLASHLAFYPLVEPPLCRPKLADH